MQSRLLFLKKEIVLFEYHVTFVLQIRHHWWLISSDPSLCGCSLHVHIPPFSRQREASPFDMINRFSHKLDENLLPAVYWCEIGRWNHPEERSTGRGAVISGVVRSTLNPFLIFIYSTFKIENWVANIKIFKWYGSFYNVQLRDLFKLLCNQYSEWWSLLFNSHFLKEKHFKTGKNNVTK